MNSEVRITISDPKTEELYEDVVVLGHTEEDENSALAVRVREWLEFNAALIVEDSDL